MFFAEDLPGDPRMALSYLKPIRYWHRPGAGLLEVFSFMKANNIQSFADLDKEYIELYATSLLAIALQEQDGADFWIAKPPPPNDPPDMVLMTPVKTNDGRGSTFNVREIEVTRSVSVDRTLVDTILKKDQENVYPDAYILVCFIEVPGVYNLVSLSKELGEKLTRLKNVVLVFHGARMSDMKSISERDLMSKVSVIQVHRAFETHKVDMLDSLEKWKKDGTKLMYVKGTSVFLGKRAEDTKPPTIL